MSKNSAPFCDGGADRACAAVVEIQNENTIGKRIAWVDAIETKAFDSCIRRASAEAGKSGAAPHAAVRIRRALLGGMAAAVGDPASRPVAFHKEQKIPLTIRGFNHNISDLAQKLRFSKGTVDLMGLFSFRL